MHYLDATKVANFFVFSIYIVTVDADSSCVYYQCRKGLATISEPIKQETVETKREKTDAEIRKLRNVIEHSAMCGTEITLPSISDQNVVQNEDSDD